MTFRLFCVGRKTHMQDSKPMAPGDRHGLVTVVRDAPSIHGARFLVRCDCGSERVVGGRSLRACPPKSHRNCKP